MSNSRDPEVFQPVAGVLAAVFPGLGHAALGEVRRGALICLGVMGLFLGGMLIGGIDVVDRHEDKWWFVLQAGVGPTAFVVDSVHQRFVKEDGVSAPERKSLGRVNEVGSLFAAMAGLVNFIAVIDAFWHAPVRRRGRRGEEGGGVS